MILFPAKATTRKSCHYNHRHLAVSTAAEQKGDATTV